MPAAAGFFGGSADLAPSNMTLLKAYGDFAKGQYQEKNIRFGVREHAMASISNGIALHSSGLIPYCATFYIFTGALFFCVHFSLREPFVRLHVGRQLERAQARSLPLRSVQRHLGMFL